ncbi:hypothetical protein NAS141_04303 [Sulfitobacter sp. NAS-14.1]|nr:hypothetical protein NAS141_04303 [Sulfitobacter sp. NAS-14.1]
MDDDVRFEFVGEFIEFGLIFEHTLGGRETRVLQQHRMTSLLKSDIIVIRHPVIAMYPESFGQKELGQMKTDETGSSGDEYFALSHFVLTP